MALMFGHIENFDVSNDSWTEYMERVEMFFVAMMRRKEEYYLRLLVRKLMDYYVIYLLRFINTDRR